MTSAPTINERCADSLDDIVDRAYAAMDADDMRGFMYLIQLISDSLDDIKCEIEITK